jgi:hypothetical protein
MKEEERRRARGLVQELCLTFDSFRIRDSAFSVTWSYPFYPRIERETSILSENRESQSLHLSGSYLWSPFSQILIAGMSSGRDEACLSTF